MGVLVGLLCTTCALAGDAEASWRELLAVDRATTASGLVIEATPNPDCRRLLGSPPLMSGGQTRKITAGDLIGLRDVGSWDDYQSGASAFSISPDRHWAALQLRRADPENNSYCLGIAIVPLSGGRAKFVDIGGSLIRRTVEQFTIADFPSGMPKVIVPLWSPDGRWLAYLRRDGEFVQIWRAAANGTGAAPITDAPFDIESFAWATDGRAIVFTGRPGIVAARGTIRAEARFGYRYDTRFWPMGDDVPHPKAPIKREYFFTDLTGPFRPALPSEQRVLAPRPGAQLPDGVVVSVTRGSTPWTAWTAADNPALLASPIHLHVRHDGTEIPCTFPACADVMGVWWDPSNFDLVFLRHADRMHSRLALYRWSPGLSPPNKVMETQDLLIGCQEVNGRLVCLQEGATMPRRLVSIDLQTGRLSPIFDPNPEFGTISLGPAKRLTWRNRFGIETFGDLVLPPTYRVGERLPLVVVQYDSRGFLRGGTGDEYPIQVFAAAGFAVLSFNRPMDYGVFVARTGVQPSNRETVRNWNDRWSVQSSLEAAVADVVAKGVVDPTRIAITGLSDGASTASFALINSRLFSTAIFSTCCQDPAVTTAALGRAYSDDLAQQGYPLPYEDHAAEWRTVTLRMNANQINTPILIEASDSEFRLALSTYEALKLAGTPIEMFVFPEEYHIKWQPAHRLAIYNRNIDWLNYWLKGMKDPETTKSQQYMRWDALKEQFITKSKTSALSLGK